MKKNLLLSLFLFFILYSNAQVINGFTVMPAAPTVDDHVTVIAHMSFPSGGCSDHQQSSTFSGNRIYASALHCLGPLTFICNYSDTFSLGQLQAGNYGFIFNVNAGGGPSPCTPGIVPGPLDSVLFTVIFAATIDELSEENISIVYNPAQKKINIHFNKVIVNGKVSLYNITGQALLKDALNSNSQSLATDKLNQGLYIVEIVSDKGRFAKRVFIQD